MIVFFKILHIANRKKEKNHGKRITENRKQNTEFLKNRKYTIVDKIAENHETFLRKSSKFTENRKKNI